MSSVSRLQRSVQLLNEQRGEMDGVQQPSGQGPHLIKQGW